LSADDVLTGYLHSGYESMKSGGMFYVPPPSFDAILEIAVN